MGKYRWIIVLALLVAPAWEAWEDRFRFAILGDRTGGANQDAYARVWREIETERPAFVINVGDTIEGLDQIRAVEEWDQLFQFWKRYAAYPQYFTAGNHDIWSPESERLFRQRTGRPPYYSFDFGNAHFTVLDNSRTDDLSAEQLRFLETDLQARKDRRPKFVFFHKPFWVVYLKLGSGDFDLHRLAKRYGVCCVISGHIHQLVQLERDGILYLAVGSSGASLARGLERGEGFREGWFYQHVLAEVDDASVSFRIKPLDEPARPAVNAK